MTGSNRAWDISQINGLQLGLGLLSIGRVWGAASSTIPSDDETISLLNAALSNDVRFFDTAPAYASSEKRFGAFLDTLSKDQRSTLFVLTKMGEHWDHDREQSYIDHSRCALCRSIDRSLKSLGDISLLQLHKATPGVIAHRDTLAALDYARSCGITAFGASVSSLDAAKLALETGRYSALQFPYNAFTRTFEPLLNAMDTAGVIPIINRPFNMGASVQNTTDKTQAGQSAFQFLRDNLSRGIILTGTGNAEHLKQNIDMFKSVFH